MVAGPKIVYTSLSAIRLCVHEVSIYPRDTANLARINPGLNSFLLLNKHLYPTVVYRWDDKTRHSSEREGKGFWVRGLGRRRFQL